MYESIFQKLLFPFHEKVLKKRNTNLYLSEYQQQQWWPHEKIVELQLNKLRKLLEYSYRNVPYYKRLWKEIGFHPNDLSCVADLSDLPVLTKQLIKENYNNLIATPHKKTHLIKSTGGSTGVPLTLAYSMESYSRRNAVMWRGYSWANLPPGRKALYFWGTNIGNVERYASIKENIYNRFYNRSLVSCFNMHESNMHDIVSEVNRVRPKVIVAYVNPIYMLAKWIIENKVIIHAPVSIITGAEPLYEYQREVIQNAFNSEVYNSYGCREVMLIASECEKHSGMHMNIDHLVIECLDKDGKNICGASGELAVTDLHNFAMPFIRYKNEDLVQLENEYCSCGRELPLMGSVEGRVLDCIKTPDNRILPGEFFPHFLKDFKSISKFQVVQNDITSLEVNVVVDDAFSNHEFVKIKNEMQKALGAEIIINLNEVSEITPTKSGKHRVTISNLK